MTRVYLLAAGNGRRAGGPKAWRPHEGQALLERQLDFLKTRFAPGEIAVSIQEDWRERCAKLDGSVRWVGVDPEKPPMAAIVALLKAAPSAESAFLYHVDMPLWETKLFDALSAAAGEAVVPTYEGKKGHPVLLSAKTLKELAQADPAKDRLDFWLRSRPTTAVEVPYPCIHENLNEG